ncbi:MAG: hypothetical protein Q9201_006278 [Fulgogasparrea decipioides]
MVQTFREHIEYWTDVSVFLAACTLRKTIEKPRRLYVRKFTSPLPAQIKSRTKITKDDDQHCPQIGYMSLPPELREQILEQALVTGTVRPYRGMTAFEQWQRDLQFAIDAQRQALKTFLRHPAWYRFDVFRDIHKLYVSMLFENEPPQLCVTALDTAPHFLSVCRTAYEEGHERFYSCNSFHIPHGPLATARLYFDQLRPEHKKMIRTLVLDISMADLTIEAMDSIENQLRVPGAGRSSLPHDRSEDHWLAPTVYSLISTWRSKLAWLTEWTWVECVEIHFFLTIPAGQRMELIPPLNGRGPSQCYRAHGEMLAHHLKGIGPAEAHVPLFECYGECSTLFGISMRRLEYDTWRWTKTMIELYGWKCLKAYVRQFAYKRDKEE